MHGIHKNILDVCTCQCCPRFGVADFSKKSQNKNSHWPTCMNQGAQSKHKGNIIKMKHWPQKIPQVPERMTLRKPPPAASKKGSARPPLGMGWEGWGQGLMPRWVGEPPSPPSYWVGFMNVNDNVWNTQQNKRKVFQKILLKPKRKTINNLVFKKKLKCIFSNSPLTLCYRGHNFDNWQLTFSPSFSGAI